MDNLDILQRTALFKGIKRQDLEVAVALFQERRVSPNTAIFAEKMPAESLYIIKSGKVRISMMAGEGEEKALLMLGPGEFFGELALLQEQTRMVSARAETEVHLLVLSRGAFQSLLDLAPRTAAQVLNAIARLLAMRIRAYGDLFRDLLVG